MTAPMHSTPEVCLEATEKGETISISMHNPLLRRRKRSLQWRVKSRAAWRWVLVTG